METNPVDGLPKNDPVDILEKQDNSEDLVKYSTYKKTLSEVKAIKERHREAMEKLAQYETRDKELSEQKLIEEKKFSEVIQSKEQRLLELSGELEQSKRNEQDFRKMTSFLSGLGSSKLESKYYQLVPLDDIKLNDDGAIDQESLIDTVNKFKAEHNRLVVNPRNDLPPNKVGDSTGKRLSVAEWKSLASSKEMKERYKEVDWTTA